MAMNFNDILKILAGSLTSGGVAGALGGKIYNKNKGFFEGKPGQDVRQPRYTEEQDDVLNQLLQQGQQNMDFSGVEDLARKRFSEDTIPSIAERFTSMGGGQRSSAFESSLGRAGSDLEALLAALKPQFGQQQLQMGLQPRFDTRQTPAQPGFNQNMMQMLPQLLGLASKFI